MEAEGRLADFDRRIHPRQSEGCFVSLIGLAIHPQQGGELPQFTGADPFTDGYFARSTGLAIDPQQVTPIQVVLSSIPPRPGEQYRCRTFSIA